MRYVGVLSLIVALIAIFSNLLYGNILIRYGIVLALAILCVIFRKKIIGLIKEIKGKKNEN